MEKGQLDSFWNWFTKLEKEIKFGRLFGLGRVTTVCDLVDKIMGCFVVSALQCGRISYLCM